MLSHVGVLIISSLILLGISEFGLSPKSGVVVALLQYVSLVLLFLHTKSAIIGFRSKILWLYAIPVLIYMAVVVLNSQGMYLLDGIDVKSSIFNTENSIEEISFYHEFPKFFLDKILLEQVLCVPFILIILFTFGTKINNCSAIKRKALYKGWLFLYMLSILLMYVTMSFSYYNIFGLNGNPVIVFIYSVNLLFLGIYFSINPSFLQYIPMIREPVKWFYDVSLLDRFHIIESFMKEEHLYLTKNLLSGPVCKRMGITQTDLSRLIKGNTGKNFNQYVNGYRVRYAVSKLHEPGFLNKYSLNTLSDLCGFASNASFYRAFRKETDTTPVSYYENVVISKKGNVI